MRYIRKRALASKARSPTLLLHVWRSFYRSGFAFMELFRVRYQKAGVLEGICAVSVCKVRRERVHSRLDFDTSLVALNLLRGHSPEDHSISSARSCLMRRRTLPRLSFSRKTHRTGRKIGKSRNCQRQKYPSYVHKNCERPQSSAQKKTQPGERSEWEQNNRAAKDQRE